mgnify:CR=1 FL=1
MDIKKRLNNNTLKLVDAISGIPGSDFNRKPDADSWSIADVVEHLYRSEFGIPKVLQGKTKKAKNRDSDAIIENLKNKLLDTETKVKASDAISPKEAEKNREEWILKFKENRDKILNILENDPEMDAICLAFEHPIFGYLTKYEWVLFNIYHTERHIKQIERISLKID